MDFILPYCTFIPEAKPFKACLLHLSQIAASDYSQAYAVLNRQEQERADRFKHRESQRNFVICRALVKYLLSLHLNMPLQSLQFETTSYGKPFLSIDQKQVFFNVSHSHEYGAIILSDECEVGIDIEKPRALGDLLALAERFFHPKEHQRLLKQTCPLKQKELFYYIWTVKEAILKATGDGIAHKLSIFDVFAPQPALIDDHKVNYKVLEAPQNYQLAIAWSSKSEGISSSPGIGAKELC